MQTNQVWNDFIQEEWSEKSRNVSVCLLAERHRDSHILQGQKGYTNTLCDEVNTLISVLFPAEERGFC